MTALNLSTVRAAALFASQLQPSGHPTADQVRAAIQESVRLRGSRGCVALVAEEYGEHPECAARRMAWARRVVGPMSGRSTTLGSSRTASLGQTLAA
jgi:hypothetical protein